MTCPGQQLSVFVLSHLFFSFFHYATQQITPIHYLFDMKKKILVTLFLSLCPQFFNLMGLKYVGAFSKKIFLFKVKAGATFNLEEYHRISRI